MPDQNDGTTGWDGLLISRNLKIAVTFVGALLSILLATAIVNQTADFVALADRLHPVVGTVALWVLLVGYAPRFFGLAIRPAQRGVLQGYGLGMAAGVVVVIVLIVWVV